MRIATLVLAVGLALPSAAQTITTEPLPQVEQFPGLNDPLGPRIGPDGEFLPDETLEPPIVEDPRDTVLLGEGAMLRGLDKVSGEVFDLKLATGAEGRVGRLTVRVGECRYPEDDPEGDAYVWITVEDATRGSTLFEGWMVASSPALNPLDHPRYDVWALRCITS